MAKGSSGRLVIEIDPDLKEELYRALDEEGLNLKQWFILNASEYLTRRKQPPLPFGNQTKSHGKISNEF